MAREREEKKPPPKQRGELIKIDLPFDDALRAALETKPPPKDAPAASRRSKRTS